MQAGRVVLYTYKRPNFCIYPYSKKLKNKVFQMIKTHTLDKGN